MKTKFNFLFNPSVLCLIPTIAIIFESEKRIDINIDFLCFGIELAFIKK